MAFSAVRDLSILIASSSRINAVGYWHLWQLTEPIALGLEVLVAFEVYDLIAVSLLGLGSLGTKVLNVAVTVGVAVSIIVTLADWRGFSPWMFQVKRTVTLGLAIALMCISWLFLWANKPLRRNLVYHCRILTAYLSGVAAGYFLLNMGLNRNAGSVLFLSVCLACLMLWVIFITREGERDPITGLEFSGRASGGAGISKGHPYSASPGVEAPRPDCVCGPIWPRGRGCGTRRTAWPSN